MPDVSGGREHPSLAVVIVSYNVRDELHQCLASLVGQTDPFPTHIVVVDNASSDGTVDRVREAWPGVRVIEAGSNLGFARANNLGIMATRTDFVLLLNPDTIVPPGAIQTLVRSLALHPEAAAAGPRLVDAEGFPELSFGWTMGPLGELRQKIVGGLYNRRIRRVVRAVDEWARQPGPRDWLSGACLLIRRTDLDAVGLLDERFFMYTEDVDLCVMLRKRGRDILFIPQAEIVHLRGRSASRNPATERLRRRSQLAYYEKHHPKWLHALRMYLTLTGRMPPALPRTHHGQPDTSKSRR